MVLGHTGLEPVIAPGAVMAVQMGVHIKVNPLAGTFVFFNATVLVFAVDAVVVFQLADDVLAL